MNRDLREIVAVTLRMYLRNRMALAYSYVFPVMFLLAFIVLYKDEQPLLIQHMGELLTVTILGGACFGLPTSMVSEREHGVWRRYRLSPVPPARVIVGTLLARYLMILAAGILQVGACMLIGKWTPEHPFQLWVAFSLVTFALLGLAGAVTLMIASVVGILIARWVTRPLGDLRDAARHIGAGDLDARADTGHGPPEVRALASSFNATAG